MLTTEQIDKLIAGEKSVIKEEKMTIGKGKKVCIGCGQIVGARSLKCVHCGREFKKGEKIEEPKTQEQLDHEAYCRGLGLRGKPIYTPSGSCPVKLKDFDKDSVIIWCETVVDEGCCIREVYFPSCLIYWLREFVDVNSEEYNVVKGYIQSWSRGIIHAFK